MTKVMKPVSISMDPILHEIIRKKAELRKLKMSDFVRQLISYFGLERNDIKPVVLQIPKEVLASRQLLEQWLRHKSEGLVNQFFPHHACITVNNKVVSATAEPTLSYQKNASKST